MEDLLLMLVAVILSGCFGGLVFGIQANNNSLRMPRSNRRIKIGFLGDILVGAAASIAVFLVAGTLFGIDFSIGNDPNRLVRVIALGVLSGFAGIRLLSGMSSRLLQQIEEISERVEQVEQADRVGELLRQADFLLNHSPERALIIYSKALGIDPDNEAARIGLAKAQRRLGRLDDAITTLSEVVRLNPDCERAYYNRACYKNLLDGCSTDDVLADLKRAIELFEPYSSYALYDKDLESLRENPLFRKLTGNSNDEAP